MRSSALLGLILSLGLAPAQELPEGKGKELTQRICGNCHSVEVIAKERRSKAEWSDNIDKMIGRGATGSDQDFETIVEYLAATLGPQKIHINKATAKEIETALKVPGKQAEALVKYREDHGDFKTWDELTKSAIIDAAKLEAAKDRIQFR